MHDLANLRHEGTSGARRHIITAKGHVPQDEGTFLVLLLVCTFLIPLNDRRFPCDGRCRKMHVGRQVDNEIFRYFS